MDVFQYLPLHEFSNPNKRIYWPYLFLCVFYALIFFIFSKVKTKQFGIKYWFHPSARVDYAIWILNHILQLTVLPLIFINSLGLASILYRWMLSTFGEVHSTIFLSNYGAVFYTIVFFIVSDISRYALHYLMHHNKYLWNIHRMHHTAEVLTPITLFRVHPFEMALHHIRYLVVHSVVTALFIYLYHDVFDFVTILGANLFVIASNVLGGNLRHSHIPISFGWLERVFISPKQHQMHHSRQLKLQQSNYGSFFAFWDRMFSTWKSSKGIKAIEYGVADQPNQSLLKELFSPISKLLPVHKLFRRISIFRKRWRATD